MKIQVGQNIRSLRRKRQVSQENLAETMEVTVQAICKWETGKAIEIQRRQVKVSSDKHKK